MLMRSFVAVGLPGEIQQAIASATATLQQLLPKPLVRWVRQENVHLTLKFLGDVSPANLDLLAEALKLEFSQHEPFELSAGGIGAFPNSRKARVLWVGLSAPSDLTALQHCVEGVANRLGFPSEERPFSAHLTIGRVGQGASPSDLLKIRSALEGCKIGSLGSMRVEAIQIYKSDLNPDGSVYTPLYKIPLKTPI